MGSRALTRLAAGAAVLTVGSLLGASCDRRSSGEAAEIARLLAPAFQSHRSGGVVLVAKGADVIFHRAYGLANVELDVPMRTDRVFGIGSITKQFTAIAILQLVEQGALSLDDDARRYVPTLQSNGQPVTIDQLLSHTSGLPNVVDRPDFDAVARLDYTVDQLLALTSGMQMHFAPGNGFHYSDTGYFVLGASVERISGLPFGRYLEERILRPLGLNSTWYVDGTRVIPGAATGYSVRRGVLAPPMPISMTVPYAAGGVFSTSEDLWRWERAVRSGRVVSDALVRRAWRARTLPDGTPSGYGYGWKACTLAGSATIEHGGFVNGFQASLLHLPDDDVTVVVLVNNDADAPDAGGTARRLGRLTVTGAAALAPRSLTARERATLVGRYTTAKGDVREIVDDGGVLAELRAGVRRPLVALSATQLAWAESEEGVVLTFETNGSNPSARYRSALRCEPMDEATRQP